MAFTHFEAHYKDVGKIFVKDQIKVVKEYPRFFTEDEGDEIFLPVTKVKVVIQASTSSKSPGMDGWTMKIFLDFLDFTGHDLLEVVEESRVSGSISGAINFTFIAMIPKKYYSEYMGDFKPISLCNFMYKVI